MRKSVQEGPVKDRDIALDSLRGALVLCVLVLHAEIISSSGRESLIGYFNMVVGPVLMPLFFVISGFLGLGSLRRSWPAFLESRVWSLLWPFLIWSIVYALFVSFVERKMPFNAEIILHLTFRPSLLGPIWYLHYLLLFFLAARVLRMLDPVLLTIVFTAGGVVFTLTTNDSIAVTIHAASFFLGMSLARYGKVTCWLSRPKFLPRALFVACLIALLATPYFVGDASRDNGIALPGVLLVCAVLVARRSDIYPVIGTKWLERIGANSLPLYLVHWPIMLLVWRAEKDGLSVDPTQTFWLALTVALSMGAFVTELAWRQASIRILFEPARSRIPNGLRAERRVGKRWM